MSIKDLLEDFEKNIKPQLEEILRLLKMNQADSVNHIEAAAAKIITELKSVIHDCPCNKEILDALRQEPSRGKEIIIPDDIPRNTKGSLKYSYPNFNVGNAEMGTGKNPGSLSWPFGVDKST